MLHIAQQQALSTPLSECQHQSQCGGGNDLPGSEAGDLMPPTLMQKHCSRLGELQPWPNLPSMLAGFSKEEENEEERGTGPAQL